MANADSTLLGRDKDAFRFDPLTGWRRKVSGENWNVEVSKGNISGQRAVIQDGWNSALSSGVEADLWYEGGSLTYLSSAETLDIVSDNANDTLAGTGARQLGLFVDGVLSEVVDLNGTTPVTTSSTYLRPPIGFITSAGASLTNEGDITMTASTALTVQSKIATGLSATNTPFYTVPTGKNAIFTELEFDSARLTGGGNPIVIFKVYARFSGANSPWIVLLTRTMDTSTANNLMVDFKFSEVLLAGADLRFAALSDTNNTEARCRFTLLEYSI